MLNGAVELSRLFCLRSTTVSGQHEGEGAREDRHALHWMGLKSDSCGQEAILMRGPANQPQNWMRSPVGGTWSPCDEALLSGDGVTSVRN
jgi:hypothetical protein